MDSNIGNGVEFEEDKSRYGSSSTNSKGLIAFVISSSGGSIKTEAGAQKFLLVCVGLLFIVMIYFFVTSQFHEDKPPLRTPEKYLIN